MPPFAPGFPHPRFPPLLNFRKPPQGNRGTAKAQKPQNASVTPRTSLSKGRARSLMPNKPDNLTNPLPGAPFLPKRSQARDPQLKSGCPRPSLPQTNRSTSQPILRPTRTRSLALKQNLPSRVRHLKANYTTAVKFYLSKYRDSIRAVEPDHLVLRPRKMRSGQRFSLSETADEN
jgi:hypothetical protein